MPGYLDGEAMNAQQMVAFENLCRLPEETSHPRYKRVVGNISVILSLDAGYA